MLKRKNLDRLSTILVLLLIVFIGILSVTRTIGSDEFQLGILALEMTRGRQIYSDLWDNHGPLPAWVMWGYFKAFPFTDYYQWIPLRLAGFALSMASFYFVWLMAKRLYIRPLERNLVLIAYLSFPAILLKSFEIRSDNFLLLFWSLALWVWCRHQQKNHHGLRSQGAPVFVGLLMGLCFSCSLKSLFLCGSIAFATSVVALKDRTRFWDFSGYSLGGILGLACWVLPLVFGGNFDDFWNSFVGENINRPKPPFWTGTVTFLNWSVVSGVFYFLLLLIGIIFLKRLFNRAPIILGFGLIAVLLVGAYCFILPTFYAQSLITASAPLALTIPKILSLLTAFIRNKSTKRGKSYRIAIPCGAFVILLVGGLLTKSLLVFELHEQLKLQDQRRVFIPINEPVFDGYGHPMTHSHPLRYTSWITNLQDRYAQGDLELKLEAELKKHNIRWIIRDKRIRDMDDSLNQHIKTHYTPTEVDEVYLLKP